MIIYTTLSVITQHSHILWPLHLNPIETENYQFEVIIHALPLQNFCSLQFAVVFWMGYNRPFTFFGDNSFVLGPSNCQFCCNVYQNGFSARFVILCATLFIAYADSLGLVCSQKQLYHLEQ